MGLFGHDDDNKQPQDQAPVGAPDNGQVPTDAGAAGGADDVQGAMPPAQPPVEPPAGDAGLPTPPAGDAGNGEDDNQVPPAAPQQ